MTLMRRAGWWTILSKSIEWFLENQFVANQSVSGDIEGSE
jgi:hypothetical protein